MIFWTEYKKYRYWKKTFFTKNTYTAFFSALGFFFLVGKFINLLFSPSEEVNLNLWYFFLFLTFAYTLWSARPKLKLSEKISNSDIVIEVSICDLFELKNVVYIVPSNTSFDTSFSKGLISRKSIQGKYATLYYEGREAELDDEIIRSLQNVPVTREETFEQADRKTKIYEYGTVAFVNGNKQPAYFFAMAELNKDGVARTTYDNLKISLDALWEYIAERGQLLNLAIPIVGSGHGRVAEDRYTLTNMIISSFSNASKKKKFTNKLIICIYPEDYYDKDHFDLSDIRLNLQCMCKNKL